jgi:hypothetical protein
MGIGSIIVYVFPYPYDFISLVGFFVLMVYLRGRNEIKGSGGMEVIKNLFGFLSSPKPELYNGPLKCGKEHNEISCPNCGSKMKRVD